ncbi:MAG: hypothetical protein WC763_06850 [Candidatus Paceibacterota bacterium]|jgi:hypothetical protein
MVLTIPEVNRIKDAIIDGILILNGDIQVPIGRTLAFAGEIDFSNAIITGFVPGPPDLSDATLTGNTVFAPPPLNPLAGSVDFQVPVTIAAGSESVVSGRMAVLDMFTADKGVVILPSAANPVAALVSLPAPTVAQIASTLWLDSTDGNRLMVGATGYLKMSEVQAASTTITLTDVNGAFAGPNTNSAAVLQTFMRQVTLQQTTSAITLVNSIGAPSFITIGTVPLGFRPLSDVNAVVSAIAVTPGVTVGYRVEVLAATGAINVYKDTAAAWAAGQTMSFSGLTMQWIAAP